MKKRFYRLLADYYYMKASKYENTIKIFENHKDWLKYITNTGSIVMRRDSCLKKALWYMKQVTK